MNMTTELFFAAMFGFCIASILAGIVAWLMLEGNRRELQRAREACKTFSRWLAHAESRETAAFNRLYDAKKRIQELEGEFEEGDGEVPRYDVNNPNWWKGRHQ